MLFCEARVTFWWRRNELKLQLDKSAGQQQEWNPQRWQLNEQGVKNVSRYACSNYDCPMVWCRWVSSRKWHLHATEHQTWSEALRLFTAATYQTCRSEHYKNQHTMRNCTNAQKHAATISLISTHKTNRQSSSNGEHTNSISMIYTCVRKLVLCTGWPCLDSMEMSGNLAQTEMSAV